MSEHSNIQWCDGTVNPVMGCSGCELYVPGHGGPCYAGTDHERKGQINKGYAPTFLLPTLFSGRCAKMARLPDLTGTKRAEKPWLDGMPRLIFVSDMGDALSDKPFGDEKGTGHYVRAEDVVVTRSGKDKNGREVPKARRPKEGAVKEGGVPFEFLKTEIIDVALSENGRRHQWLWLTKLPQRMAEFSRWLQEERHLAWPENLWAGTSITGKGTLWRAHELAQVGDEQTLRFLSVEPQWTEVSLTEVFAKRPEGRWWVINGGESQQKKGLAPRLFDLGWARKLRDECRHAKVPFFLKQLGGGSQDKGQPCALMDDPKHGGNWEEWPADLRIREMPKGSWTVNAPKAPPPEGGEASDAEHGHTEATTEDAESMPPPGTPEATMPKNSTNAWTPAVVERSASSSEPHVRAAILLLALTPEGLSTKDLNEQVKSRSGGAIVGGLQRWAKINKREHPIAKNGERQRFQSEELARMFASVLKDWKAQPGTGSVGRSSTPGLPTLAAAPATSEPFRDVGEKIELSRKELAALRPPTPHETSAPATKPKKERRPPKPVWEREVPEHVLRRGGATPKFPSSAALLGTFEFAGIQYGNWEGGKGDAAEEHTWNAGYGLLDLAEVLEVDPAGIGLGGRLSLAFGARGTGGFGCAHYEPDRKVINLTKPHGHGCLAHEWGHALDNFLGPSEDDGKSTPNADKREPFVTDMLSWCPATETLGLDVAHALRELRWAIYSRPGTRRTRIVRPEIDQAPPELPHPLLQTILARYPNGPKQIMREVARRLLPDPHQHPELHSKGAFTIAEYVAATTKLPVEFEVMEVGDQPSDFLVTAKAIGSNYWRRPTELFARAFECYVHDELAARGHQSSYLVTGCSEKHAARYGDHAPFAVVADRGGLTSLYPRGEERRRINEAMGRLMTVLREAGFFKQKRVDRR